MPSTYAHYRMGQQVRRKLTGKQKQIIEDNLSLYLIGLHGPDVLFYYKPLFPNEINNIGYEFHKHSGREFFERARSIIDSHENKEPYLAYTYGVLNHFALDSACHGYIDEKINISGISHAEIEVEFDRALMLTDHKDPIRHKLTSHIRPTIQNAKIISEFYPGSNPEAVLKALESMIWYNNLLIAPCKLKRYFIYALLKVTGNYKEMHGLIVNYIKNPNCEDSNVELMKKYKIARKNAVSFIENYSECISSKMFDYSFGSVRVEGE